MPLTGRRKRNYNRTSRYGSGWRQLYYDSDGICSICGSPEDLEIHEEVDNLGDIIVKKLTLACRNCHIRVIHEEDVNEYGGEIAKLERRYSSMLSQDISAEVDECGGLDNWKKIYGVKEKDEKVTK